jgi:TorA maturation chaperone TorD
MTTTINDFSMLCRLFGNLFYRSPQNEVIRPIFNWLQQGNLTALWALSTDTQSERALQQLQSAVDTQQLIADYTALFAENGTVSVKFSDYSDNLADFIQFRELRAMPDLQQPEPCGAFIVIRFSAGRQPRFCRLHNKNCLNNFYSP